MAQSAEPGTAVGAGAAPTAKPVKPVRHPIRWTASVILIILAILALQSVLTNPRFQWDVFAQYFFSPQILDGLLMTIQLTIISMAVGIALGMILAVMQLSQTPIVTAASKLYVWFFRGTPVLVQIVFWFNLAALYPTFKIGIPFLPPIATLDANTLITPMTAGLLALSLNEGAYMAEIVRAGLLSVDEGQMEAAHSLGMSSGRAIRRIVLPQAMRVIIPPTGNEMIGMLKTTSLVSVIAVTELLYAAENIASRTFQTIPLLITASIWYIVVTTLLSIGQYFLEKKFARGTSRSTSQGLFAWLRTGLWRAHVPAQDQGPTVKGNH
ncbi:amino acid ABC transporter permease [Microbacterium kribbense]|uniref:Amino acid ABC transporter permease n=1 Tax=Microbacterium kribbense TaxID=433645 RepID=A0ABP7GV69_9MICO